MANILLISEKGEDHQFCEKLASKLPTSLVATRTRQEIDAHLLEQPLVFLDSTISRTSSEQWRKEIGQSIAQHVRPERVFILADEPLTSESWLSESIFFGHYLIRRYDAIALDIIRRVALASLRFNPHMLTDMLNSGASTQKIVLTQVKHKRIAVEAINSILKKRGMPERLCANVAGAADEIMLNALFSAPKDAGGTAYRREAADDPDMEEFFDLKGKEQVVLEMASHPGYITVCVRDFFGTLERKSLQTVLKRDYKRNAYTVREVKIGGAGLGIYDIFKSGLSLLFTTDPGRETQVWLFVPHAESYRKFRGCFQFFSFLFPS